MSKWEMVRLVSGSAFVTRLFEVVRLNEETVWLTQEQMALLFGRERYVISKHIRNIFTEGELSKRVVCAFFAHTTQHGAIKEKTQTQMVEEFLPRTTRTTRTRFAGIFSRKDARGCRKSIRYLVCNLFFIFNHRVHRVSQSKDHDFVLKLCETLELLTQYLKPLWFSS